VKNLVSIVVVVGSILLVGCKGKQESPPKPEPAAAPSAPEKLAVAGAPTDPTAPTAPTPTPPPADAPRGCVEASQHVMEIWSSSPQMQKASPEERKMADDMMANLKGEIVKECASKQWDDAQIACVKRTEKLEDLAKCEIKK